MPKPKARSSIGEERNYSSAALWGALAFVLCRTIFSWIEHPDLDQVRLLVFVFLYLIAGAVFATLIYKWHRQIPFFRLHWDTALISLAWFAALWVLSFSVRPGARAYFRLDPIGSLDEGKWISGDTFFNLSIIQSILHSGIPSTGLDGYPIAKYHVLTHYFEAFTYWISGLDVFQTQGFLFSIVTIVVFFVFAVFLISQFRNAPLSLQLLVPAAFLAVLIGTWSHMISQPLWFATLLSMVAIKFLFEKYKQKMFSLKTVLQLSAFAQILSMAKISVGMIFALMVAIVLLFTQKSLKKLVVPYLILGGPQLFYAAWALSDRKLGSAGSDTGSFGALENLKNFAIHPSPVFISNVLILLLMVALHFLIKMSAARILIAIQLVGLVGISILIAINQNHSDIFYYHLALFISQAVFLVFFLSSETGGGYRYRSLNYLKSPISMTIILLILVVPMERAGFSLYHPTYGMLKHAISMPVPNSVRAENSSGRFTEFKLGLSRYLVENKLNVSNTQLVVSQERFDQLGTMTPAPRWSLGLLVHSMTGVPLYKGVTELREYYGFSSYTEESLALKDAQIDTLECPGDVNLVKVESFYPATFKRICVSK